MANSDPTRSQVYRREWFYEQRLALLQNCDRVLEDITRMDIELKKKLTATFQCSDQVNSEKYLGVMDYLSHEGLECDKMRPNSMSVQEDMKQSHIFLIGPATLESLANQRPTNYSYVRESKLPFDNMFFEFLEPLKMKIPFQNEQHSLMAIQLKRNYEAGFPDKYKAYIFCNDEKGDDLEFFTSFDYGSEGRFFYMQNSLAIFLSNIRNRRKELESTLRGDVISLGRKKLPVYAFAIFAEDQSAKRVDIVEDPLTEEKKEVVSDIPLEEYEKEGFYTQIPNLCVNLVNYINAHNVTIVRREREATYLDKRPNGKIKKRTERRPFNLIVLRDMVIEKPEGPGEKTWELQERIFVRGYNRRFRITDEETKPKIWVPPHIKGPPNAPFREQRYQVLYEKLGREIQMFRDLGLRHDSEMWMGK